VLNNQEIETPHELTELIGKHVILLSKPGTSPVSTPPTFTLLSPVGTVVSSLTPSLRWQPLPDASSYRVAIYDEKSHAGRASKTLSANAWRPPFALQRGRVYVWQVTALTQGEEVVSPVPPAPEARFKVLESSDAARLKRIQQTHPEAHFALGVLYAHGGVLDDAEREFKLVPASDPNHSSAQKFLRDLRRLRDRKE
jgi:hypothetical protein